MAINQRGQRFKPKEKEAAGTPEKAFLPCPTWSL
jgi:hypothetical protein